MTAPITFADAIADRRRGVLDRNLLPAPIEEHRVVGKADHTCLAQASHHGILHRLTIGLVDQAENSRDGQSIRLAGIPAGETLGAPGLR